MRSEDRTGKDGTRMCLSGWLILILIPLQVSSIILSILTALGIAGAGVLYHEGKDEAMRSGGLILMIILSVLLFFLLLFLTFVIVLLVGLHKVHLVF